MSTTRSETLPSLEDTSPAPGRPTDGARWRRLRSVVNAQLFGDPRPQVGRYRLLRSLGSGAMGVVFSALDTELQRNVALKLLSGGGGDAQRRRLQREAQAMARVDHPNVVGVYDVGESDGELYVAMELVTGVTLRAWLDATAKTRSWRDTATVFAAAARGLAAAHRAGLVHRDFKPENVLVADDGRVCVVDFGLVERGEGESDPLLADVEALPTSIGASIPMAGTPAYMSPEQVHGRPVDARADVWSFCVTLFEALHGHRPFDRGSVAETLDAVVEGAIAWPRSGAPKRLERLLRRGLQVDRDARTIDMINIAAELDRVLATRRRRLVGLGAAVAAASFTALAVRAFVGPEVSCDEAAALGSAWDESRRAAVTERLGGLGVATTTVVAALDDHAERWRAQYARSCASSDAARETLAQRLCLETQRDGFDASTAVLAEADVAIARNVDQIVATLVDPSSCADPSARPLAFEESRSPEVPRWRHELARARALWNAGDDREARRIAEEVFDAAHRDAAWAVAADAGVLVGEVAFVAMEDLGDEVPILERAREDAGHAAHLAAAARASALLLHAPLGNEEGGELRGRFSTALGTSESLADPEALAILALAVAAGAPAMYGLTAEEAQALIERARNDATARLGAGHRLTRGIDRPARSWRGEPTSIATAITELRQLEQAWGSDSGEAGRAHLAVAAALQAEGRFDEAIAEQEVGVSILQPVHGESGTVHTRALADLIDMYFAAGQLERGIVVGERTIAAMRAVPADPRLFGHTYPDVALKLARALVNDGQTERALGFARQAAELEDPARRASAVALLAELLVRTGALDDATQEVEAAWRAIRLPGISPEPAYWELAEIRLARGMTMLAQGELADADAELHAAVPGLPTTAAREHVLGYVGLAIVAQQRGNLDDVRLHLGRARGFVDQIGPRDPAAVALAERVAALPR